MDADLELAALCPRLRLQHVVRDGGAVVAAQVSLSQQPDDELGGQLVALVSHPHVRSISEPLTWEQIRERYPDEWVCLAEIGWLNDTDFEFTTARVVGHGKKSRDPYDQARPLWRRHDEIGHFFTGKIVAPLSPYRCS